MWRKFFSLGLFLFLLQAGLPALASPSCSDGYGRVLSSTAGASNIDEYVELARASILKSSQAREAELLAKQKAGSPEVLDVVFVGAGPHSAFTYSTMMQANPNVKAVLFESTNDLGVFDRLRKSYYFNSEEAGNTFYGSSVQLKDASKKISQFPSSELTGDNTVLAHYAAESPVVFNNKVVKIEKAPEGANWPAKYKLTTDKGIEVYAQAINQSIGMGDPLLRVRDEATHALYQREMKDALATLESENPHFPLLEPIDTYLERARILAERGVDFRLANQNEKVMVVGSGDGGKIAVEAIRGKGPAPLYPPNSKGNDETVKLIWMNQDSQDFESFKQNTPNSRYWLTAEDIFKNKDKNTFRPEKVTAIKETTGKEREFGKLAVYFDGSKEPIYADRVLLATGYENKALELPRTMTNRPVAMKKFPALLDDSYPGAVPGQVPVALQVTVDGKPEDIFISGQATNFRSGEEVVKREWKQAKEEKGGGFLEVIGRRSEALGRVLANRYPKGKNQSIHVKAGNESVNLVLGSGNTLGAKALDVAEVEARVQLQRFLQKVRLPEASVVKLTSITGESPSLQLKGVSEDSAKKLVKAFEENSLLRSALQDWIRLSGGNAEISIPTKKDGRAVLHEMKFSSGT